MTEILKKSKWVTKQTGNGKTFYTFNYQDSGSISDIILHNKGNQYQVYCCNLFFESEFTAENVEAAKKIALKKLSEYLQNDIDKKTAIKDLISNYC